jgi:hypothetical protein
MDCAETYRIHNPTRERKGACGGGGPGSETKRPGIIIRVRPADRLANAMDGSVESLYSRHTSGNDE